MKLFWKISKIVLSLFFIAISLTAVLYVLDQFKVVNLDFSGINNITINNSTIGESINLMLRTKPIGFSLVFYPIIILCAYISVQLILGFIPFSKLIRKLIKFLIGGLLISVCTILIIVGIVLLAK